MQCRRREPLGAILSNIDAAEMLLNAGTGRLDELRHVLGDIRNDDLRAAELIRRLRTLLSKHQVVFERINLYDVIVEAIRLLDAEARRRDVQLVTIIDSNSVMIRGDRVHLQQVILNLISNAMDAMAERDPGQRQVIVQTAMRSSSEVEVAVLDTGPGMARPVLPRLFEPYFTTKEHGMGLGLSISRTIVETHGGKIWAEANRAVGAAFRFTLPVAATIEQRSVSYRAAGVITPERVLRTNRSPSKRRP